ncbi:MAG: arginine--tRNA ligase [bacterium]|nr:arginine--tRNA ligase [bacterium]
MLVEQIRTTLQETADAGDAEFAVGKPKQADHGDYASNVALVLAKKRGVNPKSLAEELQTKLAGDERFTKVEVAGPGFLNFTLSPAAWQGALADILKAGDKFGRREKTGEKIQVEFISANPTGPLHLGNARGGYVGDVLANVLACAGHTVEREYYINDAGGQIETLGRTLKGEDDAYAGPYVDELRKRLDLKRSDRELGTEAAEHVIKEARKTIERMGITFDEWFSERKELHDKDEVNRTLGDLAKVDATYEKDGALWLKSTHYDDEKDRPLLRSDGSPTYIAADLAYHYHKFVTRGFDRVINIWGSDHHGDVTRLKAGVEFLRKAEHFDGKLEIILTQFVLLVEGGEAKKMSKRAGTAVRPEELLESVEPDVIRFFFVMKSVDTHMDFDLDLAKEHSQKNPVYYLKYAYARIAGIIKKSGGSGKGKKGGQADLGRLGEPAETALIQQLAEWPQVVAETADDYQIQRVPHYALAVADAFHKFYEQCQVVSDDQDLTAARLQLVEATKLTLEQVGAVLGIELPEKM